MRWSPSPEEDRARLADGWRQSSSLCPSFAPHLPHPLAFPPFGSASVTATSSSAALQHGLASARLGSALGHPRILVALAEFGCS